MERGAWRSQCGEIAKALFAKADDLFADDRTTRDLAKKD
jgi:hypothetical protein